MTDTATKPKGTRTPRSFDDIVRGALALTLKERVDLKNVLTTSIAKEVEEKTQAAKEAATLANGS